MPKLIYIYSALSLPWSLGIVAILMLKCTMLRHWIGWKDSYRLIVIVIGWLVMKLLLLLEGRGRDWLSGCKLFSDFIELFEAICLSWLVKESILQSFSWSKPVHTYLTQLLILFTRSFSLGSCYLIMILFHDWLELNLCMLVKMLRMTKVILSSWQLLLRLDCFYFIIFSHVIRICLRCIWRSTTHRVLIQVRIFH